MRIAATIGQITAVTNAQPGPTAMWAGYADSQSVMMLAFPPALQINNPTSPWGGSGFTGVIAVVGGVSQLTVSGFDASSGGAPLAQASKIFYTGVPVGLAITSQVSGTAGGDGVYNLNAANVTQASIAMRAQASYMPDYLQWFRDGNLITPAAPPLYYPGVMGNPVAAIGQGAGDLPVFWFVDKVGALGMTAGSHVYTAAAVYNNVATMVGPPLTMTTQTPGRAALMPAKPADPTGAAGWVQPFTLPTGPQLTVTQFALANFNSPGGLGQLVTQAFANNPNGNTTIIVPAGSIVQVPNSGFQIPPFTGSGGWVYVISSNDPILNAAASPALPKVMSRLKARPEAFTVTTAIAAGATNATLSANQTGALGPMTDASGNWLRKSGWYYVHFRTSAGFPFASQTTPGVIERQCLLVQGSSLIDWNPASVPTPLNALYPSPGLPAAATANCQIAYTQAVTPFNLPAMATLQWGTNNNNCISMQQGPSANYPAINGAPNNIRFVGLNIAPTPGIASTALIAVDFQNYNNTQNPPPCTNIYFDRCMFGNDTNSPNWTCVLHGLAAVNANNLYLKQCYFWGITGFQPVTGIGDSNNYFLDGGFWCAEDCYIQCGAESLITGGALEAPDPNFPHDITWRSCISHKPLSWLVGGANYFTGAIVSTGTGTATLTVSEFSLWPGAPLQVGMVIDAAGIPTNSPQGPWTIGSLGSGTGGAGTYNLVCSTATNALNVSSEPMSGFLAIAGTPWANHGATMKDHFEFKGAQTVDVYDNFFLNGWQGNIPSYHSACCVLTPRGQSTTSTGPAGWVAWSRDNDISFHDNICWYIGSIYYAFSNDTTAIPYCARIRFYNNQCFHRPWGCGSHWGERVRAVNLEGAMPDIINESNTHVFDPTQWQGNAGTQLGVAFTYGGMGAGSFSNPVPYSPNGQSLFQDYLTWRNNILGTGPPVGVTTNLAFSTALSPTLPHFGAYPNMYGGGNVTVTDPTGYQNTNTALATYLPGTWLGFVDYTTLGFANYQGNTIAPLNPEDWNVVSGQLATFSTAGGAIGALVNAPLTPLWPDPLPPAQQGVPYSFTLTASGGNPPYTFAITSGALPAGLSLNGATGVISGTPTGTMPSLLVVTFSVTDTPL